jgi:sterol desaturase/sphingolipid hydroxylase (fatty acid hydroxylase superfamily)
MAGFLTAGAGPIGLAIAATVIAAVLLVLERLRPRSSADDARGDPQLGYDLGHAMIANGGAVVTDALALGFGTLAASNLFGLHVWPTTWPVVVQGALAVVLADGLEYGRHRLLHRVAWLWPVHALHHSIERLHVLKGPRNTFLDMGMRSLVVYAPLAAAGVPPGLLLWYPLATLVLGPIAHSNIDFRLPAFAHRLLVTPPGHRIHHAKDLQLSEGNYAVVTPLWDIVFRTFHDPAGRIAPAVGIEHDPMPDDFVRQALSPFLWRRLRTSRDEGRPALAH